MNFVVFKRKPSKLIISFLLLASILAVNLPANSAKAKVIYKTDGVNYLQVDSPIILEFDRPIKIDTLLNSDPSTPSTSLAGIKLLNITDDLNPIDVAIRLEVDGNKLNKLKVIPDPALSPNKEYRLEITGDIVKDSSETDPSKGFVFNDVALNETLQYTFNTNSLSFLDLMKGEINNLIGNYTPRQIIVTPPIRYIDEMEIIHRKNDMDGETTTSLTNVAIDINDPTGKVGSIVVQAGDKVAEKTYLNAGGGNGSRTYDFAFSGLTDAGGYDVNVFVYSSADVDIDHLENEKAYLLDKQVYKVALTDKPATVINVKNRYKMAGKSYSLYQLLAKEKDLQRLLDENENMADVKVQVVEEN